MPTKKQTAARQAYQGLTAGFGDELIDYASLLPAYAISKLQNGEYAPTLAEMADMSRAMSQEAIASDFKENPKTAMLANLLGGVTSGVAAGPKALAQIGLSAASGAGTANGDMSDRAKGAGVGALFGIGGQAVASGVNRVAKGASDMITPEVRKVAAQLKSMGIPVRLSQLMDSKFLSSIDMALSKVPFSGAGGSQEAQRKAFTKALAGTFGENADTITDDLLGAAKGRLGGAYESLLKNQDIPIDRPAFAQQLSQLVDDLALETDDAGAAFLRKQADNILNTIDNNGGQLTGKAYQKLRQTLKGAKGTNFSVGQIQKFVDDTVRNSVPDNIGRQLSEIDGQYRNMKIAEKLYGQLQNSSGQIKPETLYNAAKSNISDLAYGGGGELGTLARSGRLLRPTIPDSGTATQALGMGVLGSAGVGAYFDPTLALGALGTIGTARGLNSAMTSQYLQQGMNPAIQAGASALKNSGAIPSVLRAGQAAMSAEAPYNPDQDPALQAMLQNYNPDEDPELQAIIGGQAYNPDTDPELQAILSTSEAHTTETLPAVNSPFLDRVAMAESGGDPNARAKTSSASGMYQFTDPTWEGMVRNYGAQTGITLADKNNPDKQKIMADLLTKENTAAYKNAGFTPNEADLYAAHFLGAPSAVKAKKNPQAYGAELFPQAAKANPTIFYQNGRPRTNEEINRLLGRKIGV